MNALVIGAGGTIGSRLLTSLRNAGIQAFPAYRGDVDLRVIPPNFAVHFEAQNEHVDVVYLCAAMTKFIDCEDNADAYRINVDAPMELARQFNWAKIVYLSSEAVERGLHTNYGMHKALAEMGLQAVCEPVIARLSKVVPETLDAACAFLVGLATEAPGVYRWRAGMKPVLRHSTPEEDFQPVGMARAFGISRSSR